MGEIVNKRGVALMIVVSVLAILTSLLAGFSILSSLENKKIRNASASHKVLAKQNAIRALSDALAKLQAASGVDNITTAQAQILNATVPDQEHWVGVWKVKKCDEKIVSAQDQKEFLAWLVSGDYYKETDCNITLPENKKISIIDPEYTAVQPVSVALIDTVNTSGTCGQYAYWIDDQSLKIQSNIYDLQNQYKELLTQTSRSSVNHWFLKRQCQGKYGISMVSDDINCPLTQTFLAEHPEIEGEPNYSFLLDRENISQQQYIYLQNKFHDFTHLSLGLLTDTRNGGFRKNLRYQSNYLNGIPDHAFIFTPPTTFPAPPTTWGYLKSFLNIQFPGNTIAARPTYPLYRPQSGVNYSDCKLNSSTDSNGYITGNIVGNNAADLGIATQYGIYPIWVEFKNYIDLYYYGGYTPNNSSSSGGGKYQSLRMKPGFYFENPYAYNIADYRMNVLHCSPYVTNLENSSQVSKDRYQKQPTFRCKMCDHEGVVVCDGVLQDYPGSQNDGDKVFPFLSYAPIQYMRPIWEGSLTANFPVNSGRYIQLNSSTSYISAGKIKSFTTSMNKNPCTYNVNDVRFYQPISHKEIMLTSSWMETSPSNGSGKWPNETDQWNPLCLRSTNSSGNILQQICDVEMKYESVSLDRNFSSALEPFFDVHVPIYLTCAGLRQSPGSSFNYWHQYTPNGEGVRPFAEANPFAPISCRTAHQDDMTSISYSANFIPGNWSWCAHWLGLAKREPLQFGPYNLSSVDNGKKNHAIFDDYSRFRRLFDLPSQTLDCKTLNLGFLQHMNVGGFSYHPTYAFGNSYQNPWIPRQKIFQENPPISGSVWSSHNRVEMLYDYSYCLNRALWDAYFFAATTVIDQPALLLNHHQKVWIGFNDAELYTFNDAAKNMAIHGAFNVNSTSKNAWIAFFGSTIGNLTNTSSLAEYSRIQTVQDTSNIGMRQLNQLQLSSLANKVVEQIKNRGVAGSLGEFINRKLISKESDVKKIGLKGVIQSAIDETTINEGYGGENVTSRRNKTWFDDEAATGPFWACKPGYLTQADILQSTATVLCARGDTFLVHFYGNSLDNKGNIAAEVRGEAVVQRMPEFLTPNKESLGRKYKILSIKWRDDSDIPINRDIGQIANDWLSINVLKAVDQYSQDNNIYINSVHDNYNKDRLKDVMNSNFNGTSLNSIGGRIASLLVALDSTEEALNAYEKYTP